MRNLGIFCRRNPRFCTISVVVALCALVQNVAMASTPTRPPVDESANSIIVPLHLVTQSGLGPFDGGGLPSPAGCVVSIEDAHSARSVVNSAKVNAKLQCNYPVAALSLSVTLWKLHAFGLGEVQASVPAANTGYKLLENNGTFKECTNNKNTTWYGTATADSLEGGEHYEAMVRSPHNAQLTCGT